MDEVLWFLLSLSGLLIVAVILLLVDTRGQRGLLDAMRRRVAAQDREIDHLKRALVVLLPDDAHPTTYRTTEEEEQKARVRLRIDARDPALDLVEDEEIEDNRTPAVRRHSGGER